MDEVKAKVDLERYNKLEQRLGMDREAVAQTHDQINSTIARFFVDAPPALPSTAAF